MYTLLIFKNKHAVDKIRDVVLDEFVGLPSVGYTLWCKKIKPP